MMPHLMPTRSESVVFFEQQIDLSRTLPYLEERRARGEAITLFHVVLAGLVRVLATRPQLHRFVVGRRLYQRHTIELSFAVKKQFTEEARLTTVKVAFASTDTLDDVVRRVLEGVGTGKGDRDTTSEREMSVVTRLPRFAVRGLMAAQRALDYFNLLPASMVKNDPLYASMFVANLGSIGLDAAFHHLYEYGTVPLFAAIGRVHRAPVVTEGERLEAREVCRMRYTFDERIADGYYAARSLELLKGWVENPASLEEPPHLDDAAPPAP
ncbi:MAG: 2-oxo acid dehydrogenase subunit E2 [Myxococcota bacterium]